MLNVLDLFSGIGGFSLGLKRAGGFRTVCYVEIETYCQEALLHRMQGGELDLAPIFEDISRFEGRPWRGGVDCIVGGFPCQDLSVAGNRLGLAGNRSSLWAEFARIIGEVRPRWVLVENVPGMLTPHRISLPVEDEEGHPILTEDGKPEEALAGFIPAAMGCVLGDLADLGYGAQWRVLDAQFWGVPQRRRRVFIVGHLGGPCPPEILFESEGGGRDSAKSRKAGKDIAATLGSRSSKSGAKGGISIEQTMIARPLNSGGNLRHREDMDTLVSGTIQNSGKAAGSATQQDAESKLLIAAPIGGGASGQGRMSEDIPYNVVTHSLTGEGHDASEDGTGRGTPLVMGTLRNHVREGSNTDYTVIQDVRGVRDKKQHGIGIQQGGPMYTLDAMSRHAVGVRRLTPTECERLQGFPDGWTAGFADSTRYKMLGNAVAVPVIEWIGRRINEVIA